MSVATLVGRVLAELGVETVFGVVGSGNFHVTNALVAHGARFVAARHEGGAATMADAYARMSGRVGVVSVHQGPGLTNAMTGITEAAKSRTPLIVLAGEATEARSNFHIDQDAMARAVGAIPFRIRSATTAVEDAVEAFRTARAGATVLLNLPLNVQNEIAGRGEMWNEVWRLVVESARAAASVTLERPAPEADVVRLARLLSGAERPVFVAGRGARHARSELLALADRVGALLATSAVAKGLFRGSPWDLDISGGFASPLAAELISGADVLVGWGCALNMWTTRHGRLIGEHTRVVQVDVDPAAIGAHRPVELGVVGDTAWVARAAEAALDGPPAQGYRTPGLATRLAEGVRWRSVPYKEEAGEGRIDPRTLTIALDDLLPPARVVATDSGNFMGYPAMFLDVPDERGFCFTQAFQSIGLGLASAIGAAVALPDRLPVAALGDGGALMGISELETVVRLGLPMVIVVYDDEAYGAEVHHFGPSGHPLDTVTFPAVDLAAIARGYGCAAVTVRERADLGAVASWLAGPRDRPLLVHAKVGGERGSWWLEEAFRGH
ncbi:thiamine pyrophosphate-binding protein [Nonomuraea africana]|uniref:Thiamine pyrophosphate-dependent acetolactate synthase large subunit-like protein n=1 Tax=Nonomuraea africana TaxID=46171 RepID=A0ABR9KGT9_9ACTN|nr:thiamine pyrophosphate-binding protein [Nonomuraea africana]MBE1561249.1 thiamine pyrophosphate-dependent acetolactate synthase large subunit-like protein [Nonomuraea africana]